MFEIAGSRDSGCQLDCLTFWLHNEIMVDKQDVLKHAFKTFKQQLQKGSLNALFYEEAKLSNVLLAKKIKCLTNNV